MTVEKKKKKKAPRQPGWVLKSLFIVAIAGTFIGLSGAALVFWHFSHDLPKIITVADYRPAGVTRLLGNNGREDSLMGEFFKERRYLIPYEKMPEVVVRAFISAEDDKFFEHPGINISSIIRASIANLRAGHTVQGGSTITQQVAKSLLLTPEKTLSRKVKEVILSVRIERNLSKQQILYLYLNQIYLGHGAYGVQSATRTYFKKDISQITIAEAALLAGMPQAPGKYSPLLNPKKAKERQLYVLRRMFENKFITQAQMTEAAAQPLRIYHDEDINTKYAAYLVEYVRKYLVEKYGEKAVYEDGLTVALPTTPELSQVASKSVKEGLGTVDKRMGYRGPIQTLKDTPEMEKYLKDSRIQLIERKIHHQMLMPDGRLDAIEAMHHAGIQTDAQLLAENEVYQGAVTSVDDRRKVTGLMIGGVKAELPLDRMKWARPVKDEKYPDRARGEPTVPSKVFHKGDVIQVRIVSNTPDKGVLVALEQDPTVQGAIFSLETQTGYVLAMEGGYDFEQSEFNRAVQALRQPGSAFKPIIYSAGLEKGYTPSSIIVDSPLVYEDAESGKWKPSNFEEKFYGDTTYRQALIKSRNIPTIKIVQNIQVPFLIEYAKRLGMDSKFNADLSISLGSAVASLMDLTRVYALFPRLGRRVTPIFITQVRDRDGRVLEEHKPQPMPMDPRIVQSPSAEPSASASPTPAPTTASAPRLKVSIPTYPPPDDPDQVLDPRVAYVMTNLMKEVVTYGTGHDAKSLGHAAAGKTGTTSDYLDAWFMGFTPQVVTGAWVGYDNQRSIGPGETGARAALPIWLSFMREAVKAYPDADFQIPPGVVFASIDPATGKLAPPNSSSAIREAYIEGTQPTETADSNTGNSESPSEFFKDDVE